MHEHTFERVYENVDVLEDVLVHDRIHYSLWRNRDPGGPSLLHPEAPASAEAISSANLPVWAEAQCVVRRRGRDEAGILRGPGVDDRSAVGAKIADVE